MKETELRSIEGIYLTEDDVAKKYIVCKKTIYNLRKKSKLINGYHYIYVNKQIRYISSRLEEYFGVKMSA
tara:strand:+ start:566 stop:775 length:210 start_codon:yes stop_codon:yes gene_type:complete